MLNRGVYSREGRYAIQQTVSSVHYKSSLYMSHCNFWVVSATFLLLARLQTRLLVVGVCFAGTTIIDASRSYVPRLRRSSRRPNFKVSPLHVEVGILLHLRVILTLCMHK